MSKLIEDPIEKYSHEWEQEKRKTCKACIKRKYYACKRHTAKMTNRSWSHWLGSQHSNDCPFLKELKDMKESAIIEYTELVKKEIHHGKWGFYIKCPYCIGHNER